MLDVLIQNGLIFDGLGSAPMRGDIGIQNGKIDVGVNEAAGLVICQRRSTHQ